MNAPARPDLNLGILRDERGALKVGLEVIGHGRGAICLTAEGARDLADGLARAADLLEEMLAPEVASTRALPGVSS